MAAAKTYRAITEVHITEEPGKSGDKAKGIAPTPPKVAIIPAKGLVDLDPDSDVCVELLSKNAIRLDDSGSKDTPRKVSVKKAPAKKAPAKKAPAKAAAKTDAEGGEGGEGGSADDLV